MKLSRDQIKFIAIITMTFNHIAHGLMTPGTLLYEVYDAALMALMKLANIP